MSLRFNAVAVAALGFASLMAIPAHATITLKVTDSSTPGGTTYTGVSCAGGTKTCINVDAADGTFDLLLQTDNSNAPGGPAVITFSGTIEVAPGVTTAQDLTLEISDTSFSLPTGPGGLVQTMNVNTPADNSLAAGTLTSTGYYGTGANNVLFCADTTCNAHTGSASFPSFAAGQPGQTVSTAVTFAPPFSLDEVVSLHFNAGDAGKQALFQGTLSATVPEPGSVLLLGGVLFFVTSQLRKRQRNNN